MFINKTIVYLSLLLSFPFSIDKDYQVKKEKVFYEIPEAGIFICTKGTTVSISKNIETLYYDSYVNRGINCNLSISLSVGQIELFFPKEEKNYICISDKDCVIESIESSADILAIRMPNSLNNPIWNTDYYRIQINSSNRTISVFDNHSSYRVLCPMERTNVARRLDLNKNVGYRDPDKSLVEKLFKVDKAKEPDPDVTLISIGENKEAVISINGDTLNLRPLIIRDGLFPPFYLYPKLYLLRNMPNVIFTNTDGFVSPHCTKYHVLDFTLSAFMPEPDDLFRIVITNHI